MTKQNAAIEGAFGGLLLPLGFELLSVDGDHTARRWEYRRLVEGDSEALVVRSVKAGWSVDIVVGVTVDALERRLQPLERLFGRTLRSELFMPDATDACVLGDLYAKWPIAFAHEDALITALDALCRFLGGREQPLLVMWSSLREPRVLHDRLEARLVRWASKGCSPNLALLSVYAAIAAGEAASPLIEHRRQLLERERARLNRWYGARHDAGRRAFELAMEHLEEPDGGVVARAFEEQELARSLGYWSLVRHPTFGLGRVSNITGDGEGKTLEVEFLDSKTTKTLRAHSVMHGR